MEMPCEFVDVRKLSPLISECTIKVCYVDDEKPNRNGTVITKEVAQQMAQTLPGCPIVGHYSESREDFEEHNRILKMGAEGYEIIEDTRPYGFIPTNAKIWFQHFKDDNYYEREYLCAQGYLWTGQYPECKRVIEQGNNQSMELNETFTDGNWAELNNSGMWFFIINEAVIDKLCILGEDVEPCFEGSSITAAKQYSIMNEFKAQLYSLIDNINKNIPEEGGKEPMELDFSVVNFAELSEEQMKSLPSEDTLAYSDANGVMFFVNESAEEAGKYSAFVFSFDEEGKFSRAETPIEISEENFAKIPVKTVSEASAENKEDMREYSLDDIPEYQDALEQINTLNNSLSELKTQLDEMTANFNALSEEITPLREFKANKDREEKLALIDSFYMLSDEDKKEFIDNVDKYSLKEIKAELSILCVDHKVSFSVEEEEEQNQAATRYNLNYNSSDEDEDIPDWVRAVLRNQN